MLISVAQSAFMISRLLLTLMIMVISSSAFAQGMGSCAMCGSMGWIGMILGGILVLALIAALVALTIFLFRKSQRGSHP